MTGKKWLHSKQKRTFDIVVAVMLLPLCLVVISIACVIMLLVYKTNPLFMQQRVGKGGSFFMLYKVRTLRRHDYEDSYGVCDMRSHWMGRLLRIFIIDELPQIVVNVIKGTLSMVGPRPLIASDIEKMRKTLEYTDFEKWWRVYTTIPQGWTGAFGLESRRFSSQSHTYLRARVDFDIWYSQHASFWIDIKILLQTVLIGFVYLYHARPRRVTTKQTIANSAIE